MKSILNSILVSLLLITNGAYAQEDNSNEVNAFEKANAGPVITKGIRAGWNAAVLAESGSKPDTAKSLNRFYVGFFTETESSKLFAFGTGVEYLQNGTQYDNDNARIFHTLSIPIHAKLKIGPAYGLGGMGINFTVIEQLKINGNTSKLDPTFRSNWFDVPLFAGAGVNLGKLHVEMRYYWGLFEIRNGLKHQYLQLGLGIKI